jgi:indole-3-glycerol phosphate synthase
LPNSKVSRTTPETQARKLWKPPTGVLGDLVQRSERRSRALLERRSQIEGAACVAQQGQSLSDALRTDRVSVIAEVKRASPSRGSINPGLSVEHQVREYQRGGARAISVLTEPELFGGSDQDLQAAGNTVSLPILRKDFHISAIQLVEARALGASAALIIARALDPAHLAEMVAAARDAGVEALVEVRDENELEAALAAGATIIGVNNRDLESLNVDPDTVSRVMPNVPRDCIGIAESGYGSRVSIDEAARAGADAVLIGSFLSASNDPAGLLVDLVSVPCHPRGEGRSTLRSQ